MALDILLPFWGEPAYLYEAVRSVQAQDSDDWLLTVVDDQYPDESVAQWFADHTADDPRIRYLRNETNLGITDNYRRCLELATQDVIVFFGCDDRMHPQYVRTILDAHERFPDVDIIQPGVQVIDEHGDVVVTAADRAKKQIFQPRVTRPRVLGGEELAASLLRANWTYWPSLAFRREAVERTPFLDGFPLVQDLALQVDMVTKGSRMLVLPDVVFSYRRHAASASSAKLLDGSRFAGERRYFEIAADTVARLGWTRAERAARTHLASRLYAATLLPTAVKEKSAGGLTALAEHVLRPVPGTFRWPGREPAETPGTPGTLAMSAMRRAVGVRSDLAELAQFLVALLVLSVPLWVLGAFVGSLPAPLNALPVSALSAFLPGLASLLAVLRSRNVRALLAPLRAPRGHVGWWLASSTVFSVPVYAAGMLTGGAWPELSAGQVVGLAVAFLAAALGEELGWTTFALPRLLRVTGSPLRAWMALTGVWALVHLIPYLQTGNDLGWVAAQTVQLALMRAAVVALALGSGDRGWLPVVTHGAYNMAWTTAPGTYHPWLVDLLAAPMVAAAVMAAAVAVRRLPARAYR